MSRIRDELDNAKNMIHDSSRWYEEIDEDTGKTFDQLISDAINETEAEITLLTSQVSALVEAIEPLSDMADLIQRRRPDIRMDDIIAIGTSGHHDLNIRFQMLHRAREAVGDLRKARDVRDVILRGK